MMRILVATTLVCLSVSAATAQNAARNTEEIRKLVACAERYKNLKLDPSYLKSDYFDALIAAQRFEDACSRISKANDVGSALEEWVVAQLLLGKPEGLDVQLETFLDPQDLAALNADDAKKRKQLKRTVEVLQKVHAKDPDAVELAAAEMNKRISHSYMRPDRFWIQAVIACGGESMARSLIARMIEQLDDPIARDRRRDELIAEMGSRSEAAKYRQNVNRQLNKIACDELIAQTDPLDLDGMYKAIRFLGDTRTSEHQRDALTTNVLASLASPDKEVLSDIERKDIAYRLASLLAEKGDWERALELIEKYPETSWQDCGYYRLCQFADPANKAHSDRLADCLPDAEGKHTYGRFFVLFLMRSGHFERANANLISISGYDGRYRNAIEFYELLHNVEFSDIEKLAAKYKTMWDDDDPLTFFHHLEGELGVDHLADIAIHNKPEAALELARRIPKDKWSNPNNSLGFCVTALLDRKRLDLAVQVAQSATPDEIEAARLFVRAGKLYPLDDETALKLEPIAPNDKSVLGTLIKIAIENGEKQRALDLARRSLLLYQKTNRIEAGFAKAGWAFELLEVADVVKTNNSGNVISGLFQKSYAKDVGQLIDFKSADEAIEYSRKHLQRGTDGARFLLELAVEWAGLKESGLCL